MKLESIVWRSLLGVVCMSFMLGTAAGEQQKVGKIKARHSKGVACVVLTGSRLPQCVTVRGQQVNSAAPLDIIQNDDLHRNGATSIAGMLAMDPSIFVGRRTH
jgi:hypothetical protein